MSHSSNKNTRCAVARQSQQHNGRMSELGVPTSANDYNREQAIISRLEAMGFEPIVKFTDEQRDRALDTLNHACQWRIDNPAAWAYIVATATALAAEGHRIGAQHLIELVRAKDFAYVHGVPTKTNNSFAPVFARWLAQDHPEWRPLIELRACALDTLGCRL